MVNGTWISSTGFLTILSPTCSHVLAFCDTDGDCNLNAFDKDDDGVSDVNKRVAGTSTFDPDSDYDGIGDALTIQHSMIAPGRGHPVVLLDCQRIE